MVIDRVLIKNFRAIAELEVDLEELTVLVGANSTGKSTVIKALEWFFEDTDLSIADVRDQDPEHAVSVRVTFASFSDRDRAAFPGYTTGDTMTLLKVRDSDGSIKLTGRGLVYPPFRDVRAIEGAVPLRQAYTALRASRPELDLPAATSKEQALTAMDAWERDNTDLCEEDDRDATHLLGAVGRGVLRQRFKFVLVPALRDAAEDVREARGSTLSRLLAAIAEQRAAADERVAEFEAEIRERYEQIVVEAHGTTLNDLSRAMTEQLRAFVSQGEVQLEARPGVLDLPGPRVVVEAGEGHSLTDISRQGHGFQRAFVITALRYLSEAGQDDADAPTIFLAIEEPELYQHPVRARHFAAVLDRLAARGGATVQVLYATHSPYFVNARNFERVRVFRRTVDTQDRLTPPEVSSTTVSAVAAELAGIVDAAQIPRRLARTIDANGSFSEAFFGNAVILAEGPSDVLVLREVATMTGLPLEADGIVPVHASKTGIPVALAVLSLLQIPTYVVFDADAQCDAERRDEHASLNQAILRVRGVLTPEAFPGTQANESWTAVEHTLESYLCTAIEQFDVKCQLAAAGRDWRSKSGETYAEVIRQEGSAPTVLSAAIGHARALAGPSPQA